MNCQKANQLDCSANSVWPLIIGIRTIEHRGIIRSSESMYSDTSQSSLINMARYLESARGWYAGENMKGVRLSHCSCFTQKSRSRVDAQ